MSTVPVLGASQSVLFIEGVAGMAFPSIPT